MFQALEISVKEFALELKFGNILETLVMSAMKMSLTVQLVQTRLSYVLAVPIRIT
jgi:hypothetical protein